MIGKKIVSQEEVPLFTVKEVLSERNKDGELTYEQQQAFDYSKKFAKVTPAKGTKLLEQLKKVEGLDEKLVVKLIDILPSDEETMQLVLYKSNSNLDAAKTKEVLEIISKYAK